MILFINTTAIRYVCTVFIESSYGTAHNFTIVLPLISFQMTIVMIESDD